MLTIIATGTAAGSDTNLPVTTPTIGIATNYIGPAEFTVGEHFLRHLHVPPTFTSDFWDWQRGAIIPVALLAAGGIVWATGADQSIQRTFASRPLGLGSTDDVGQYTLISLGAVHALGLSWLSPEPQNGWREIEVYAETEASTGLLVNEVLKPGVGRARPNHGANDSFPSGHAAASFASATYISRYWMRQYDDGLCPLVVPAVASAVSYGTATAVGLARLDNNAHWCSDVVMGAGIGMLLGQCLYALHFDERGVFRQTHWRLQPVDTSAVAGLALVHTY